MTGTRKYTIALDRIDMHDLPRVGGKNASLGEMIQNLAGQGIRVPGGFAVTAEAYWAFLDENRIRQDLIRIMSALNRKDLSNLRETSDAAKGLIKSADIPDAIAGELQETYRELSQGEGDVAVAVRSSATAEDLPGASFAGQQETYLNVTGEKALLEAYRNCLASLFTSRAIKYRIDQGFEHMDVALSVGVQRMVRADVGCSGVAFTLEPDTGFKDVVVISGVWGLGENIVQGTVDPDEFVVFKPTLQANKRAVISSKLGKKQQMMVYEDPAVHGSGDTTKNLETPGNLRDQLVLSEQEVEQLAKWAVQIEDHYQTPMDIEWAKDGLTGELYILQARPETVHAGRIDPHMVYSYELKEEGRVLTKGISLGGKIAKGRARVLNDPNEAGELHDGEVLVTDVTNPDWDPIMKRCAAIVTNRGGRTSHAAIVARELGVVAVVGTGDGTNKIRTGQEITVSCAQGTHGVVYDGALSWEEHSIDTRQVEVPETEVMLILADPDKAFQYSFLPNSGIGLMRMEFAVNNSIRVHPMALLKYDELEDEAAKVQITELTKGYERKEDYFTDRLAQAIATVAAAFYPKDVIVRMSDFKSNEYANLIGGRQFEPHEENPMLGFRGASRYYSPLYKDGFRLECEAMRRVRDEMGLTNVKLMIPFCRTVEEGRRVVDLMAEYGLERGANGLEIYTMIEVPSNVILADRFAQVFDGFSIGSNDLTQLTLGLDRDSELVSPLFNERNEAITRLISQVIRVAKDKGIKIGLCGQAPSDFPDFAQFLVEQGIDSISFNPDALIDGMKNIHEAEEQGKATAGTNS